MSYTGKVCQGSLTTTLGSYRNTPRFIVNRFGQLGTETFLQIATNIIDRFVDNDRKCRYIMYNMFCQYILQPCYPDNTVVEYCKEDCEAIFRDCQEPLNHVIGAVKFYVQQNGVDSVGYLTVPDTNLLSILTTCQTGRVSRLGSLVSRLSCLIFL